MWTELGMLIIPNIMVLVAYSLGRIHSEQALRPAIKDLRTLEWAEAAQREVHRAADD